MSAEEKMNLKTILLLTVIFVGGMLALSGYAWVQLPADARIPTHWGVDGKPNQYSSKAFGLLFLPLFTAALVPFIAWIVSLDPRRAHVAQSQKFLIVAMAGTLLLMSGIHVATVLISLGHAVPMNTVVLGAVGVLFLLMGNYMGKVRSNFFMGVRTPWTLSSELSWNKTHRLAGKLFMASGLLFLVMSFIAPGPIAIVVLVAATFAASIIPIVYSYIVWKHDPARKVAPHEPTSQA